MVKEYVKGWEQIKGSEKGGDIWEVEGEGGMGWK